MIGSNKYAITADHWTSLADTTFLAVTCHFINDDWESVSLILSCSEHSGRTTAAECKREIENACAVALVTDTKNTMTALGKLIDGDHHYCVAHVLELTTVNSCFLMDSTDNSLLFYRDKALMASVVLAKECAI